MRRIEEPQEQGTLTSSTKCLWRSESLEPESLSSSLREPMQIVFPQSGHFQIGRGLPQ